MLNCSIYENKRFPTLPAYKTYCAHCSPKCERNVYNTKVSSAPMNLHEGRIKLLYTVWPDGYMGRLNQVSIALCKSVHVDFSKRGTF